MFNAISKTVTCDSCGKSIPVKAYDISSATTVVKQDGWTYSGLGTFACPKCTTKPSKKRR